MLRPSLLDFLPAPGAASHEKGASVVDAPSRVASAVPAAGRTHLGKSWHVYLDPRDRDIALVALLCIFEEFGRHVGRGCVYTVPALGRTWRGARIDLAEMFTAMRARAESLAGRAPGNQLFAGFVTQSMYDEERHTLIGPAPVAVLLAPAHGLLHDGGLSPRAATTTSEHRAGA